MTGEGQGDRKRAATDGDCHQAKTRAATKNMTKNGNVHGRTPARHLALL